MAVVLGGGAVVNVFLGPPKPNHPGYLFRPDQAIHLEELSGLIIYGLKASHLLLLLDLWLL